jgi:hypothetical protein
MTPVAGNQVKPPNTYGTSSTGLGQQNTHQF